MDYNVPYRGQDVGRVLTVTGAPLPWYGQPGYDDQPEAGYIDPGTELIIVAYYNSDPAESVYPIWLVVADKQQRMYIIVKDDAGQFYTYKVEQSDPLLWIVAGGLGVAIIAVASNKKKKYKKKKVSGISAQGVQGLIIPGAVVVGGGILFYKIGQKFGLFDDAAEQARKKAAAEREAQMQASIDQICSITPTTKTEAEWVQIADKLENCFDYAGYLSSYRDEAVYQLARAKNDCDVQKMIRYFGHRALRSPFLVKSGDYTLSQAILERLTRENVDAVNSNYARKGIKFSW